MQGNDLIDRETAQGILDVSKATFYKYIKNGRLAPADFRLARPGSVGHLYRLADVQELAAKLATVSKPGRKRKPKPGGVATTWIRTAHIGQDGQVVGTTEDAATWTEDELDQRERNRLAYIAELAAEIDGMDLPEEDKAYIKRSLCLNREPTPRQKEIMERARAEFLEAYEDAIRKANAPQEATSRDGDGNGNAGRRTPRRTAKAKATETAGEEDPP